MENKKKKYQEPALDIIKMRSLPCLQETSEPATDPTPDPARGYYFTDPSH